MKSVIQYGIPNAETIAAIEEVQRMKADPDKKTYGSFEEILKEANIYNKTLQHKDISAKI